MVVANKQEVGPCKVEISVEVEPDQVQEAMARAYRELGEGVRVPGFRKGKAPLEIVRRYVPEERAKEYARVALIEKATLDALVQEGILVYDSPSVSDIEFSDEGKFTFKATVPLPPKVELGKYRGIEVTREVAQITEEQVAGRLEELREMRAEFVAAEPRPLEHGDFALAELQQEDVDPEPRRVRIRVGDNSPEFDEGVKGMVPGKERDVELAYTNDHSDPSLAGTTTKVHVKLIELQEKKIPELNDDFAGKVGEYNGLDELRNDIRQSMQTAALEFADRQVENRLMEEIVRRSTVSFPDVMKERQVAERLRELLDELQKHNMTLDDYLEHTEQRMEDITAQYEKACERSIRVGLVLWEIADRENIKVEDADVELELARMAKERGTPAESLRAYLEKTEEMRSLRHSILQRKVLDFLVNASNIRNVEPKGDVRK